MCKISRDYSICNQVSRIIFVILFAIIVVMYNYAIIATTFQGTAVNLSRSDVGSFTIGIPPAGYLVWDDQCRMQDMNSISMVNLMKPFHPSNYTLCPKGLHITEVMFDLNFHSYMLYINDSAKKELSGDNDVSCCYQSILRAKSGSAKGFVLNDCVPFNQSHFLSSDVNSLIISCKSIQNNKEIQRDAYILVPEKLEVRARMQAFDSSVENKIRPVSVLILGIDGVSRFNLRRTLPKTASYLLKDGWFELSGYNKIDYHAFPNLMALLSGFNMARVSNRCKLDRLNSCNLIWDLFRKNGYVTAYAEDSVQLSAFKLMFEGLESSPVDYNSWPFMLAMESSLEVQKQNNTSLCIGSRYAAEYIYDYALEFGTRYKSEPFFGLFIANTFNPNLFDDATAMDLQIAKYLVQMKQQGILNDSIVIFLSDHGSILGNMNHHNQSFLDERVPLIFIWIPPWFQLKYPSFVRALKINRYRLTNPYDIHMTLKHILEISGRTKKLPNAEHCSNCQSVLVPVSLHRSCKGIAIEDQWCACNQYEYVKPSKPEIIKAVRVVIMHLNEYLRSAMVVRTCLSLSLKSIDSAQRTVKWDDYNVTDVETYRIRFTVTAARAKFEVTVVESNAGRAFEIIGSVSRLDSYKSTSSCIQNVKVKKYCICNIKYLWRQALNQYRYGYLPERK